VDWGENHSARREPGVRFAHAHALSLRAMARREPDFDGALQSTGCALALNPEQRYNA